jgi:twitching motility protein PilT
LEAGSVAQAQPQPAANKAAGKLVLDVVLAKYLNEARRQHASDLHLSVGTRPEARLGSGLTALASEPLSAAAMDRMLDGLLSGASRTEFEQSGAACFAVSVEGLRLRVNASETLGGKKIAVRLLDETARDVTDLGLPAEVEQAVSHHQGLVLVTGPAGHGKTTTLAALVELVNSTRACHIISVEDPVEILLPSKRAMVSQREVHTHTKSFERALKGALRQDPDVIVVGELRDATTVRMALSASETGHLVIGTMNTPSTTSTIDRLIDLFPPSDQPQVRATLSAGLRLVLNQRLVPRAGGGRRVAVCELLPGSLALSNLIREDKLYQLSSLMQRGRGAGILRMAESASELVRAGLVRKEDIEHLLPREREVPPPEPSHAEPPPLNEPDSEPPDGLGGLLTRAGNMFRRGGQ